MQKGIALKQYGILIVLSIVTAIGLNNVLMLLNLAKYSPRYQEAANILYAPPFIQQVLYTGILMPMLEELLFRGLVFRVLKKWISFPVAMVISAVLFALYHGNLVQFVYAFFCGLLLAFIYEKYGSLLAPILSHMTMNLVAIILTEFGIFAWMFHDIFRAVEISVVCGVLFMIYIRKLFQTPEIGCYKNVK